METIKYEYKRFVNLFMLYGLFTITLSVYSLVDSDHFYWMLPGIGMGSVFVTLSLLYYYENVLSPLLRARLDEKQAEEAQLRLQQRGGTSSVYQWFLLPLLIEFFIIAYFGITLTMPAPILGTPYTHPYQYGQIYNRVNAYFKTDTSVIQAITKPDVKMDPIDEQAEKKRLILKSIAEESFDDCLHDNKFAPSPCWQENIGLKILLPDKVHALQVVQSLVYTLPFIISISFGFIGVLFYILRDAAVRYAAKDLYYKTFVTYLTRLIFAPVLCVAVAFLFSEN
ncbi:MAG: hypothetical protein G8345_03160 [Magnetococcales bacterium]|nr:hypothetical protein [Magnetococcales bacterium]NGZ25872.1 hypothetical protein [Magnetococcales bacterium]